MTSEPKPTPSVTVAGVDLGTLLAIERLAGDGRRTANLPVIRRLAADAIARAKEPPPALARSQERPVAGVDLDALEKVARELAHRLRYAAEVLSPGNPRMIHLEAADVIDQLLALPMPIGDRGEGKGSSGAGVPCAQTRPPAPSPAGDER